MTLQINGNFKTFKLTNFQNSVRLTMSQSWEHRQKFENLCFAKKIFYPQNHFKNNWHVKIKILVYQGVISFLFIHKDKSVVFL